MANGYLYLVCADCERHPREDTRRNASFTILRDFENMNGHGRWDKDSLEAWLARHVQGECPGAAHVDRYENVIRPERLRLTPVLPDPRVIPIEQSKVSTT